MKTNVFSDDKHFQRYIPPVCVLLDSKLHSLLLMASGNGTGANAGDDGHNDGEFDDDDNGGKPFGFEYDMEDRNFFDAKPAWNDIKH